jgi:DNA-binding transcriptional LysR family regulator
VKGCDIPPTDDAATLADRTWIGFGDAIGGIGPARWMAGRVAPSRIFYKLNTVLGLSQAIEAGLGIGFAPCFIGDRSPNLVRLLRTPVMFDASLWLLTHPDLKSSARVRAFVDFMAREMTRHKALIEGRTG